MGLRRVFALLSSAQGGFSEPAAQMGTEVLAHSSGTPRKEGHGTVGAGPEKAPSC